MRLLAIADTHVPRRAKDLPPPVWAEVAAADVLVHAGDWADSPTFERLSARSRRLVAVYGNNDGPELRARLPDVAYADLDGLRLAVVHDTGTAVPWDTTTPGGRRLLNPGSPTDRRRQPHGSYLTATVTGRQLVGVVLHQLERRDPDAGGSVARVETPIRRSCSA